MLVLADFNEPAQNVAARNNGGGAYQTWVVNAECQCHQELDASDALGAVQGAALKLSYSVSCPPYFDGWFMFLSSDERKGLDLRAYDRLGFFVKGTTGFSLEVKDRTSKDDGSPAGVAHYTIERVGSRWRQVEIPFSAFQPKDVGPIDWSGIRQVIVVFSDISSDREGSITLDHFYVSKGPASFSRVAAARQLRFDGNARRHRQLKDLVRL